MTHTPGGPHASDFGNLCLSEQCAFTLVGIASGLQAGPLQKESKAEQSLSSLPDRLGSHVEKELCLLQTATASLQGCIVICALGLAVTYSNALLLLEAPYHLISLLLLQIPISINK